MMAASVASSRELNSRDMVVVMGGQLLAGVGNSERDVKCGFIYPSSDRVVSSGGRVLDTVFC